MEHPPHPDDPGSRRPTAVQCVEAVLDPGSWRRWDEPCTALPEAADYRADLLAARERTGLDESVITGEGRIRGRRVALVAGEFGFLGGSIGVAAGTRLVTAVERATRERLPLLATPASGGTRMQEGTIAFLQMVKVAAAITDHTAAGLPYLVHLRHPTTGGVLASWGSLGHVTSAEPGALIGFLGPRVHQALYGEEFPPGVQTAENLYAHGLVDAVLPIGSLGPVAATVLDVLCGEQQAGSDGAGARSADEAGRRSADGIAAGAAGRSGGFSGPAPMPEAVPPADTADSLRRSRRPERPGLRDLLRHAEDVTALSGTGAGERDPGLLLALARFGPTPCVVVGHDRGATTGPATAASGTLGATPLGPAGLREARRGMRLASGLGLPLLTVIDTAGAALSKEAEEGGLAAEIARSLADLVTLSAPTLCLILGQGAGGAALALLPADRVLAARHAWLSPLPPEGASVILYRTTDRAAELAERQGIGATALLARGIVDAVVPEHPDAADDPVAFLAGLATLLGTELARLRTGEPETRRAARRARYRRLGEV
ncbi:MULTISPECIES: carboxyl transferase domain-containing protein [unclassified Streptomyces]|uniref:carboxyl transferase domain-containing protein n=1 Tax=unclassified Streptomyces TaxID=2593676 RepID=UPI000B823880|nr:carboxyl transferase domain-containing protein [Streptomyces sp. DvalAA-14]MYS20531.1 acetyl-CoA carboxyl transferase [Streptomyces sp. SID4948]